MSDEEVKALKQQTQLLIDRINDLTIACEIHLGRINEQDKALDYLDTQNLLLAGRVKVLEDARQRELDDLEGAA